MQSFWRNRDSIFQKSCFFLFLSFFIGLLPSAWAEEELKNPQGEGTWIRPFELGYSARQWTTNDGLPPTRVEALSQSPEGYLLIGTSGGVARFNGYEISGVAPEGVKFPEILQIFEEGPTRTWFVGSNGPLVLKDGDEYKSYGPEEGVESGVWRMAQGEGGELWAVYSDYMDGQKVCRFDGERFNLIAEKEGRGYVSSAAVDDQGRLWWTLSANPEAEEFLYSLSDGEISSQSLPEKSYSGVFFRCRVEGTLCFTSHHGVYSLSEGKWELALRFSQALPNYVTLWGAARDGSGNHWMTTMEDGVWVCHADGMLYRLQPDAFDMPSSCRTVYVGDNGSVWIGGRPGLYQFYYSPFTLWPANEKIRHHRLNTIGEDGEGVLWFAGPNGVYFLRDKEDVMKLDSSDPSASVIAGRRKGGAWLSLWGGPISEHSMDGGSRYYLGVKGEELYESLSFVRNIVETEQDLWIGHEGGLYRLINGQYVKTHPEAASEDMLLSLIDGKAEGLYVGFRKSGLFVYRDGQWESLGSWQGLSVENISVDSEGGVWMCSGGKYLSLLKEGEWKSVEVEKLEIPESFTLLCGSDGGLWFQGLSGGVSRLDRKEVEKSLSEGSYDKLQRKYFDVADGLPSDRSSLYSRSIYEDSRGRIWLATSRGACVYNPQYWGDRSNALKDRNLAPVIVEKVFVDDERVQVEGDRIVLAPNDNRLEISYIGMNLANPQKIVYRYKLEGFDEDWVDVGNRRVVYYQNLPAGRYTFQVMSVDENGNRSEKSALDITVKHQWWEHPLAQGGATLVLFLIVWFAILLRVRSFSKRESRRLAYNRRLSDSQEEERRRIAGELHDSLGQELLLIKASVAMVSKKVNDPEVALPRLNRIVDLTQDAIESVRTIAADLRPPLLDRVGLKDAVEAMIETASESSSVQMNCDVSAIQDNWKGDRTAITHVFRVLQECLNNALKYSQATCISLVAKKVDDYIEIHFKDNGKGFSMKSVNEAAVKHVGGLGLSNIKERVRFLGGAVRFRSAPNEGTSIYLFFPTLNLPDGTS